MNKRFFNQLAPHLAAEPYRVFFPLALLAGVAGVILWPLFYWGWLSYYPMFAHGRVMIEGFVGGFAIGFLGTALPKMLSAQPLKVWQVGSLLSLHAALVSFHMGGDVRTGDGLFTVMMIVMVLCLLSRLIKGKTVPPPGMILAGMGIFCGIAGAAWSAFFGFQGDPHVTLFMQRLLYQAFILLPLLGVGSFIFPMILGTPNHHARLSGPHMTRAWKTKAGESALIGCVLIASYWIEVHDQPQSMSWVRATLCGVWITKESGWLTRKTSSGIMPLSLRAGIVCLLGGMVATGVMKTPKIALDHTLYIGGFGLITMIVATRVIYGHSGQEEKFQRWIKPLAICSSLILLGMLTRVTADFEFMQRFRISHHIYAAGCWVIVSIIWAIAVLPSVRKRPFPSRIKPQADDRPSVMNMQFRK
ncbi:MAG: NnrS family protein [Verrucomicrobiae bacterium]|nr:NnrS family protein [Verrucomicrobiae bacterium]NNJ42598.1 NnrS family protein [Akkermansiaceae bacterium]